MCLGQENGKKMGLEGTGDVRLCRPGLQWDSTLLSVSRSNGQISAGQ